mmetsp:Transcript_20852/g.57935  ORF Transcript_20852/g.57935 Transcript_20852/m.57935 type:complete len:374 (-) Transcript_20852:4-1125(-)
MDPQVVLIHRVPPPGVRRKGIVGKVIAAAAVVVVVISLGCPHRKEFNLDGISRGVGCPTPRALVVVFLPLATEALVPVFVGHLVQGPRPRLHGLGRVLAVRKDKNVNNGKDEHLDANQIVLQGLGNVLGGVLDDSARHRIRGRRPKGLSAVLVEGGSVLGREGDVPVGFGPHPGQVQVVSLEAATGKHFCFRGNVVGDQLHLVENADKERLPPGKKDQQLDRQKLSDGPDGRQLVLGGKIKKEKAVECPGLADIGQYANVEISSLVAETPLLVQVVGFQNQNRNGRRQFQQDVLEDPELALKEKGRRPVNPFQRLVVHRCVHHEQLLMVLLLLATASPHWLVLVLVLVLYQSTGTRDGRLGRRFGRPRVSRRG